MLKEYYESIHQQLLSKTWFRVTCVSLLILLLLLFYFIWKTPKVEKGVVGEKERWDNFQQELINFRENESTELFEEHDHTNEGDTTIEQSIEYFFFVVKSGDINLLGSTMNSEQFQKDFFQYEVVERTDKMTEAMQRITRDNRMERIEIVRSLWQFQKDSTRIVVDLYYSDLTEPIRVNLMMKSSEISDTHFEDEAHSDEVYFVNTSIWELIRNIEGKAGA